MPKPSPPRAPAENAKLELSFRFETHGELGQETLPVRDEALYGQVRRWNYVLAHRRRLGAGASAAEIGRALAGAAVETPGKDEATRAVRTPAEPPADEDASEAEERAWKGAHDFTALAARMARAGLVEVSMPLAGAATQGVGYAARLFPWEMVIAMATSRLRQTGEPMAVVRQLAGAPGARRRPAARPWFPGGKPRAPLFVSAEPERRAEFADFDSEAAMFTNLLHADPDNVWLRNPSLRALGAKMADRPRRDFLHLTGYDGSQIPDEDLAPREVGHGEHEGRRDCFMLRGEPGGLHLATPDELAQALCPSGRPPPRFVTLNSFYSARRLAPRLLAAGVGAVMGFFDTVTDASAEAFFTAFYRLWGEDGWGHPAWVMPAALREARREREVHLGGGVVLWSAESCFPRPAVARRRAKRRPAEVLAEKDIPAAVSLTIQPETSVNYASLHNGGSLFREFRVRKAVRGRAPPLRVRVVLDTGGTAVPCRFTAELPEEPLALPLTGRISIPLHAALLRHAGEGVRTSLYVRVRCGPHTLAEWTRPVTILSADEWRDEGRDFAWLPSFVLPRDPAVLRIVAAAVRYLRAVADDPAAGFSGYQALATPPSDADEKALQAVEERNRLVVDQQVRAVWLALQHDFRLTYYNPPPTYTARSQRLRSPTQILACTGATCIDLALLFAACLEFVGIHPAIFLIQGHAFPGYWRSDAAHAALSAASRLPFLNHMPPPVSSDDASARPPWILDAGQFEEVLAHVNEGGLVPFESTFVTFARSFSGACAEGLQNLRLETFEAMLDLDLARREDVTPIALLDA